jgi:hypothetical protein
LKANAISVDQVQQNLTQFLSNLQNILSEGAAIAGDFKVDTVEVDAQISSEGQIGFMGSQVGMSGSTGIKFVFKRIYEQK